MNEKQFDKGGEFKKASSEDNVEEVKELYEKYSSVLHDPETFSDKFVDAVCSNSFKVADYLKDGQSDPDAYYLIKAFDASCDIPNINQMKYLIERCKINVENEDVIASMVSLKGWNEKFHEQVKEIMRPALAEKEIGKMKKVVKKIKGLKAESKIKIL